MLYNSTFSVVVSADENGTVCVWNVTNGQREGRFMKAHGDAKVRLGRSLGQSFLRNACFLPCALVLSSHGAVAGTWGNVKPLLLSVCPYKRQVTLGSQVHMMMHPACEQETVHRFAAIHARSSLACALTRMSAGWSPRGGMEVSSCGTSITAANCASTHMERQRTRSQRWIGELVCMGCAHRAGRIHWVLAQIMKAIFLERVPSFLHSFILHPSQGHLGTVSKLAKNMQHD